MCLHCDDDDGHDETHDDDNENDHDDGDDDNDDYDDDDGDDYDGDDHSDEDRHHGAIMAVTMKTTTTTRNIGTM